MKVLLTSLVLALATPAAMAGGFTLQGGQRGEITRISIGYTADPIYQNGSFQVVPVYEAARFHHGSTGPGENDTLYQLSAVPMLRYYVAPAWYVEAGIGVSVFNRTRIAQKQIATSFQFSDHIGIGWQINRSLAVGYRFSHFSNASIKQPNDGINSQALVLTVSY